jgi:hypothetical protein
LFSPLALAAGAEVAAGAIAEGAAGALAVAPTVGAAGTAYAEGTAACGLPPQAASSGSNSASSSSGEKMFHRVKRFIDLFLSSSVPLDSCSFQLPTATYTYVPSQIFPRIVFVEQME